MKNSIKKFLEFNGTEIYFTLVGDEWWVALKPICEALKVDWQNQHKKLKEDITLGVLSSDQTIVAGDDKLRKMTCLPEKYIYGWLFQIQSQSPDLLKYKLECYNVLYDYFHGLLARRGNILVERITLQSQIQELEERLKLNEDFNRLKALKKQIKEKSTILTYMDKDLVTGQISLFKSTDEN